MTEQEIIDFLKKNKETGIAFAFMPEEVQDWVNDSSRKIVYLIFKGGLWEDLPIEATANEEDVFALPDSFQIKQELQGGWVEFEIKDGEFFIKYENDLVRYHWSEWNYVLVNSCHYKEKFTTFGGWQYKDCDGWFTSPQIENENGYQENHFSNDGECKPAIPTKIRFWRESR